MKLMHCEVPDMPPTRLPLLAPSSHGLYMPAEIDPHAACWIGWPASVTEWERQLAPVRREMAAVARAIARFEPVRMVTRPEQAGLARRLLGPTVEVVELPQYDIWLRDVGPTFLSDGWGGVAGVNWIFNDWGGRYPAYAPDELLAQRVLRHLGMRRYAAPLVLEGGSINGDGQGTLLTSEECLLNANRNPGLDRRDLEEILAAYLGVRRVIWLGQGLAGDHTDGHVDNLALWVRPGVVLTMEAPDPGHPNHRRLADNLRRLRLSRDAAGRRLEVLTIPAPSPTRNEHGWMAKSYINSYLANGGVVMPAFGDPEDEAACQGMAAAFPDRQVVQIPLKALIWGGGGIHCASQQQPAGQPLGPAWEPSHA